MSFTMTRSASDTFTLTSAKYLASKVTADMRRCSQLHGRPSESEINNYGTELALLLNRGYAKNYEFGFKLNDKRVLSFFYEVVGDQLVASDDRPGKIYDGTVSDATWFNFLTRSAKWWSAAQTERDHFNANSPINRISGEAPTDGNGYWVTDLSYSADGTCLRRRTFRPF
jgi:hypothetical protein